jgi:hypothetical protein
VQRAGTALVHTTANALVRDDSHPDFAIFTGKSRAQHAALNASASLALETRNQLLDIAPAKLSRFTLEKAQLF